MIANSIIHILDIDSSESIQDTISHIFWKYGYKVQREPGFVNSIDFSEMNIKIKDWTGWTQLLKIRECEAEPFDWIGLEPTDPNIKKFIQLKDCNIALYDKDTSTHGFHGEVKYKYTIRDYQYLKNQDKVTMRILVPYQEQWQMFMDMKVLHISRFFAPELVGYEIYTKSGFYNANGFHLCSSDAKAEDEKDLWK